VRVDETLYEGSSLAQKPLELPAETPITPVFPLFLDLPLITGDELPHAPYVAATCGALAWACGTLQLAL
jgi:hypothetical protein